MQGTRRRRRLFYRIRYEDLFHYDTRRHKTQVISCCLDFFLISSSNSRRKRKRTGQDCDEAHRRVCSKVSLKKSAAWAEQAEQLCGPIFCSLVCRRGFIRCYLSTHDKEEFYRRIGYSTCSPVCGVTLTYTYLTICGHTQAVSKSHIKCTLTFSRLPINSYGICFWSSIIGTGAMLHFEATFSCACSQSQKMQRVIVLYWHLCFTVTRQAQKEVVRELLHLSFPGQWCNGSN